VNRPAPVGPTTGRPSTQQRHSIEASPLDGVSYAKGFEGPTAGTGSAAPARVGYRCGRVSGEPPTQLAIFQHVICFLVDHRSQQVLEEIRDQARDAVSLSDEVMVGGE